VCTTYKHNTFLILDRHLHLSQGSPGSVTISDVEGVLLSVVLLVCLGFDFRDFELGVLCVLFDNVTVLFLLICSFTCLLVAIIYY